MSKDLAKSLNQGLSEFFLENLEQRLETDPMSVGVLMDIDATSSLNNSSEGCWGYEFCNPKAGCEVESCWWY
jgi:hypothetical protein